MPRKLIKNLILLAYSWITYNLIFITALPYILFDKEFSSIIYIIYMAGWALSGMLEFELIQPEAGLLSSSIRGFTLICLFSGCITLFFWWRKQTIIRAWLFSLSGMITGPGLIFFMSDYMRGYGWGMLLLNIFYLALLIGNFLQKRFWPGNRFCNSIRLILKRPCLRT